MLKSQEHHTNDRPSSSYTESLVDLQDSFVPKPITSNNMSPNVFQIILTQSLTN